MRNPWSEGQGDPISQADLLAMVRETEPVPTAQILGAPSEPPIAPPNPTGVDLTPLRLRCYPPVSLEELRPRRLEPRDSELTPAMRTVPVALSESRFGGPSAHLGVSACEHWLEFPAWLAFAQERGLGRAAAEWAVYRLVEAGRLCVVWPEVDRLAPITNERATERAERYRGRPETVTDWDLFEHGRILQIRSTPALWEWWHQDDGPASTETESNDERTVNSVATESVSPTAASTGDGSIGAAAREGGRSDWSELGDAKRAILQVLADATGSNAKHGGSNKSRLYVRYAPSPSLANFKNANWSNRSKTGTSSRRLAKR